MPPTLILIRHAQALHNVIPQNCDKPNHEIPDPDLTEVGYKQLNLLKKSLMNHRLAQNAGLIITSPMRRTIQTASGSLDWLMDKGVKLEADAAWQENSDKPCDTGTVVQLLGVEFPSVDFSTLDPIYPEKKTPAGAHYAHNKNAILGRAQASLKKLYNRPEEVIIVVSHSGFLRVGVSGCCYANADYRVFDFEDFEHGSAERAEYKLKERNETKGKGGLGLSDEKMFALGYGLPEEQPAKVR